MRTGTVVAAVGLVALATGPAQAARAQAQPVACVLDGDPVVITGSATDADSRTYRMHPVDIPAGTTRVEVSYRWANQQPLPPSSPLDTSVVDLGLWDADGYRSVEGWRGWSGSREGRIDQGDDPVFVQADDAMLGYRPDPIEPGMWFVETGFATVHSSGLTYELHVSCTSQATGPAFVDRPVDPAHVADPAPGWYHGDFHMHGRHSNGEAPGWDDGDRTDVDSFVDFARAAELDFTPITDYVTNQHWRELGPTQAANPDLVIWPSREVITYFGHMTVFGETPSVVDYRHGFEDVSAADIQALAVADGALFGVAHPTIFPPPLGDLCRGCYFELGDVIDWDLVDTIEVLTGPRITDDSDAGGPGASPIGIQNPFVTTAVDLWEDLLLQGHRITAVSGSDDKLGPELGSSATAVYASELSRAGLIEGIRAGHATVKLKGVADSPHVEMQALDPAGIEAMIGDALASPTATATVTVTGGSGQLLVVTNDGAVVNTVPIDADPFQLQLSLTVGPLAGPLGSFWRIDVWDPTDQALTVITNPVFVGAPEDRVGSAGGADAPGSGPDDGPEPDEQPLPATGGPPAATVIALLTLLAATGLGGRRR